MSISVSDISDKKGRIRVDRKVLIYYLREYPTENPLFKEFVPVESSYKFTEDKIEYLGYSPKFRSLSEGEKIPLYDVEINSEPVTKIETSVTFKFSNDT